MRPVLRDSGWYNGPRRLSLSIEDVVLDVGDRWEPRGTDTGKATLKGGQCSGSGVIRALMQCIAAIPHYETNTRITGHLSGRLVRCPSSSYRQLHELPTGAPIPSASRHKILSLTSTGEEQEGRISEGKTKKVEAGYFVVCCLSYLRFCLIWEISQVRSGWSIYGMIGEYEGILTKHFVNQMSSVLTSCSILTASVGVLLLTKLTYNFRTADVRKEPTRSKSWRHKRVP
ncbi:hypothetical protein BDN72DRAFT_864899 [Pluteus cervinus]|uniref:Uncharacterized protein n=1 Tax=Pluteus cervinus TaxID=181527 RepID=A0ACD3A384_9AGAR|nr:hypothetical protein BDN72DRAFT_864899 [Pluteus cervinus]